MRFSAPYFLLCVPLVMIGLSIPLILEKVPPNGWYGFRIPKTMSSPAIWYPANKLGGQYFIAAGIAQFVLLLWFLWSGSERVWFTDIAIAGPLLAATLLWFLKIRRW